MKFTVETVEKDVPVTVLSPEGNIDGTNYTVLIDKARELYDAGTRHILLDLTNTPYVSSAGLVALQSICQLMRGEEMLDTEAGWNAIRSVGADQINDHKPYFKLLSLQPQVDKALDMAGFKEYFDIFTDRDSALKDFG